MNENEAMLDEEQLRSLKEIDQNEADSNLLADLIDLFVLHTPDTLSSIFNAIDQKDRTHLQKASHKLKGSCANLGANRVRILCAELETSSQDISWSDAHLKLKEIEISYHEVVEVFNRDWREK